MKNKYNIPYYPDKCFYINDISFEVNSICFEIAKSTGLNFNFRIINNNYYGIFLNKKYR